MTRARTRAGFAGDAGDGSQTYAREVDSKWSTGKGRTGATTETGGPEQTLHLLQTLHGDPYRWLARLLLAVGAGHRGKSDPVECRRSMWQCPAHPDASPSLSLGHGRNGAALLHCFAGCATPDVMAALSIPMRYLFVEPPVPAESYAEAFCDVTFPSMTAGRGTSPRESGMRLEAVHEYGRPPVAWLERWRHPTTGVKDIRWESRNHRGERVPGLGDGASDALPLYLEHDAIAGVALGEPVIVVESESSADALVRAGHHATTWAGGASTPNLDALGRVLGDHPAILVIADADGPGRRCADRIAAALPRAAVHRIPGDDGTDARDLLDELGARAFAELTGATYRAVELPTARPIRRRERPRVPRSTTTASRTPEPSNGTFAAAFAARLDPRRRST